MCIVILISSNLRWQPSTSASWIMLFIVSAEKPRTIRVWFSSTSSLSQLASSPTARSWASCAHPIQIKELEHLMDHFPNISKYARTSCCLQGPPSASINEVISQEGFAEYHLLDYSSISGPNHLNIHSAIQLLQNVEIQGKAERFIRTFHPGYISLIKGAKDQHSSGQQWKRHRSASSMATSVDQTGSITINVRYD